MCRSPTAGCLILSVVRSPRRTACWCKLPQSLKARFNLDVRIKSEVVRIDRAARSVRVRELETGREYDEAYDALVLATGASPVRPPIPGIERANHFVVRDIPDVEQITAWSKDCEHCRFVVVGGGYIGLEMAEQLRHRGFGVTVVEALPQVMAPLDPEMAAWLHAELRANGVALHLNDAGGLLRAALAQEPARASIVVLKSGQSDCRPTRSSWVGSEARGGSGDREQVWRSGKLGGIRVNEHLQTSDPHIWAVGDAIEVRDGVTGQWSLIPLAGPANRQGRIAADNIFGRPSRYDTNLGHRDPAACSSSPPPAQAANEKEPAPCGHSFPGDPSSSRITRGLLSRRGAYRAESAVRSRTRESCSAHKLLAATEWTSAWMCWPPHSRPG